VSKRDTPSALLVNRGYYRNDPPHGGVFSAFSARSNRCFLRECPLRSNSGHSQALLQSNHEWQGDSVCGGCAPREPVLDCAGTTKLLHRQLCGLVKNGRRGGVPMKRIVGAQTCAGKVPNRCPFWVKRRDLCSSLAVSET